MFSTISPFFTYSRGTCTVSSTSTATYGVKPLSVHHSYSARIRYGRVEVDSRAFMRRRKLLTRKLSAPAGGRPPRGGQRPLGGQRRSRRRQAWRPLFAHHLF